MNLKDKIYIAGHKGLAGSAILRNLRSRGYSNIIFKDHKELDLTCQSEVDSFFKTHKPDYVILAAARVGGIYANNNFPAEFIYQNIMIQANVINCSYIYKVKRLLFLGSTCIYPKLAEQPIKEESLLAGHLESTNEPYAVAKIAGIKLCESYNRQYKTDFRSIMPTNLYGINDNFHDLQSHVVPALIGRFHNAKNNKDHSVQVWGSGNVKREFMFSDDMADASLFILELDRETYMSKTSEMLSHINLGTGDDITIKELAEIIKKVVGFKGKIIYDSSKPDGAPRKLVDISKLTDLGWTNKTNLENGIKETYNWYQGAL